MPRRHGSRSRRPHPAARESEARPPAAGLGGTELETGPDGDWLVRKVPGAQATKFYRCPGCDHEIIPGTPHVVSWPADDFGSVEDRRHWHSRCWAARGRRGPTSRRW